MAAKRKRTDTRSTVSVALALATVLAVWWIWRPTRDLGTRAESAVAGLLEGRLSDDLVLYDGSVALDRTISDCIVKSVAAKRLAPFRVRRLERKPASGSSAGIVVWMEVLENGQEPWFALTGFDAEGRVGVPLHRFLERLWEMSRFHLGEDPPVTGPALFALYASALGEDRDELEGCGIKAIQHFDGRLTLDQLQSAYHARAGGQVRR